MSLNRKENFKIRFEEFYPMLCNVAYRYIADKDTCEDVVQDTFLSIWHKGKDSLPKDEFAAYIVTSVKNNCISFLRKQTFETLSIDDSCISNKVAIIAETEKYDVGKPTASELVDQLLNLLPPKCAIIFKMSKLNGMKYREIASALEISEKTVENQMGKAIRILRDFAAANPHLPLSIFILLIYKGQQI